MSDHLLAFYAFLIISNVYAVAHKWGMASAWMALALIAMASPYFKVAA